MVTPIRVLYVDDCQSDRELVRDALEREQEGFELTEAASRSEFEARLDAGGYDLVLSDLNILGFEGLRLLDAVRARKPDLPVVIITGTGSEEIAAEAMKRGASGYIVKSPKLIRQLPQTIRAIVEKRRVEQECKRTVEALAESEARLRLLAENAEDVIYRYEFLPQRRFTYVSPASTSITGYTPEEHYANPQLIFELVHPDDRHLLEAAARGEGEPGAPLVLRWVRKDGRTIWTEQRNVLIFDDAGQLVAVEGIARDVTRRKQDEEQLRLQAAALESAANAIVITDRDGTIQWVNPAWTRLTGYPAEEAVGQNPRILKSGYHDRSLYESLWKTILAGRVFRSELVNRRKDGSLYTEEETITPLIDARGKISHFIGIKQDITQRKHAEQAAREQRNLAEALRETASVLNSTLDFEEVAERILNTVSRVVPNDGARIILIEGGKASVARSRGYKQGAPKTTVPWSVSLEGTVNLNAMALTGQPLAIPDTRAYPGWQEWPGNAWVLSSAGAPIRIKEKVVGFLTIDCSIAGFYTHEHANRLLAFADQAATAIQNARLYEEVRRHAAELERRVRERTIELTGREGELRAANERLKELDQMKSEFVSNVSHELRTPLANIISYLWLLEKGRPEKRAEYMSTLHRESALLNRLIEDLLHISRMDLGQVRPALQTVDVNAMVTTLVVDRGSLFAESGLMLEHRFEPDLPVVRVDERMLVQVLTNLMSNAMRYTPRGGTVTISTESRALGGPRMLQQDLAATTQVPTSGSWVTLLVRDTGPGISEEEQSHLFERFFRGEAALQSGAPGTGLGLPICQEIVRAHEGRLTVESRMGAGATFTVWLPVAASEAGGVDTPQAE